MPGEQEEHGSDEPNDGSEVQTEIRWQDYSETREVP